MVRNIQKISVFMILFFMLFSCASSPHTGNEARMPDLSYDDGESVQRSQNEADNRMVTYSVSLELSVKDPDETSKLINEQIKQNKGFMVSERDNNITARIPSENMDNFLNNVRALGKTKNETKTGTDITDAYRDNVIRLDSLKNVRNRYITLLERANTISDVLTIEKELQRVNLEIERLEGRIKHAELSVAYSIITVRFGEKAKPGPVGWIFYGLFRGIKWLFVWN